MRLMIENSKFSSGVLGRESLASSSFSMNCFDSDISELGTGDVRASCYN